MEINIRYFGQLVEIVKKENEVIKSEQQTIGTLLEDHYNKNPGIKEKVFVVFLNNQKVESFDAPINNNDNISLMPPFAGG